MSSKEGVGMYVSGRTANPARRRRPIRPYERRRDFCCAEWKRLDSRIVLHGEKRSLCVSELNEISES